MIYQFPMSLFTCGGTPNWHKFIEEMNTIFPLYQMAQCCPNYLTLSFDGELTLEQMTAVEQSICTHTSTAVPSHNNYYTITPAVFSTTSTEWTKISTFKCDIATTFNYIEIISYLKDGSEYDVKVEDSSNSPIAQSLGLSNTEMQVVDLGPITQPTTSICTLYLKTTGTVNIDSIIIYIP